MDIFERQHVMTSRTQAPKHLTWLVGVDSIDMQITTAARIGRIWSEPEVRLLVISSEPSHLISRVVGSSLETLLFLNSLPPKKCHR